MKVMQKILRNGFTPVDYSHIPHMICLSDFNTNYPSTNRIDRIAREINEYLKYCKKNNEA